MLNYIYSTLLQHDYKKIIQGVAVAATYVLERIGNLGEKRIKVLKNDVVDNYNEASKDRDQQELFLYDLSVSLKRLLKIYEIDETVRGLSLDCLNN